MKLKYLSHILQISNPVYGRIHAKINLSPIKSINKGDACNVFCFAIENHWGTHVDCPAHFFSKGMKITDYATDFWLFHKPQVLTIKARPEQIIYQKDLIGTIKPKTDLLLLKSGWGKLRGKRIYSFRNPGLAPELGLWLRKKYPSLRAIGFDWISLSSYKHRELGRKAHRAFLDPEGIGHPIVIVEDMNIPRNSGKLQKVWVMPLRIKRLDSAPCTVIGMTK